MNIVVRWAGTNPLFECAWGDSELPITALTQDLREQARRMKADAYPEMEAERERPTRILGKRGAGGEGIWGVSLGGAGGL